MYYYLKLLAIVLLFVACSDTTPIDTPQEPPLKVELTMFDKTCSIRAIDVISQNKVWFGGSNNQFGYTEDGGETWHIDSIKFENHVLEFRGVKATSAGVFLLAVGSPGLIFKSTDNGASWNVVYQEDHEAAFYNSIEFWDAQHGIAVGDPIEGCLSILLTEDGGENWKKISCDNLPPTIEGEAGFAASNTNIAVFKDHTWLVTGGQKSRIFYSPDKGETWEVHDTPIVEGSQMTGIFSVDFYDDKEGIVVGGDWNKQNQKIMCKAITHDGGKSWDLTADGKTPSFRSCVQYIPHTEGQEIFAVGSPGISYSKDGGQSWMDVSEEGFYTIRVAPDSKTAWLAGKNKIAKMTFDE